MSMTLGSNTFFVPGAYAVTKVVNQSGAAIPAFNVGVVIGKQMKGVPYTEGTGNTPNRTAEGFILPYTNASDVINATGQTGDSEVSTFTQYAKKTGAGTVFTLNVNPLTRVTGVPIVNVTPVTSFTIRGKDFGAHTNDITITIATSIHTVCGTKNVTYLSADGASPDNYVKVNNAGAFKAGDTIYIQDNVAAIEPTSKVVQSVSLATNTIYLTTTLGAAFVKTGYARVFQYDTDNQEVSKAITTTQGIRDFYGSSKLVELVSVVEVVTPATIAKTSLGLIAGATKGTSPAATATDWQNVVDNFPRWAEEFALANKFYMRVLGIVTSDAANQAVFVGLAATMRAQNKPIAIITGCALGDYALTSSDAAFPVKRTYALNSDEVQLAGVGLDGLAAYLSLAGEIFGIRLANAVNHNQTRDDIVASTVERAWFAGDATMTTWTTAGIIMPVMTVNGWKINQGLTTYQDQSATFNIGSKKTYLVMLRDLADFDLRVVLETIDTLVGADAVTAQTVSAALVTAGEKLVNDFKYIKSYSITKIEKQGTNWNTERQVALDSPNDFFGITNTIVLS